MSDLFPPGEFPDDAACLEHLWRTRYSPDGTHAECPKCERERVFKRYATKQGRQSWTCTGCGHHVHPTAGTIFAQSPTSLAVWYRARHLLRHGATVTEICQRLGIDRRTATSMRDKLTLVGPKARAR